MNKAICNPTPLPRWHLAASARTISHHSHKQAHVSVDQPKHPATTQHLPPPTTLETIKMSGAAAGDSATHQATVSDSKDTSKPLANKPAAAQLEEDDEFEDFPVEGEWRAERGP